MALPTRRCRWKRHFHSQVQFENRGREGVLCLVKKDRSTGGGFITWASCEGHRQGHSPSGGLGFRPVQVRRRAQGVRHRVRGELHGKPAKWTTKISNALMGDVELELLEPSEGDQALKETLDAQAKACITSGGSPPT